MYIKNICVYRLNMVTFKNPQQRNREDYPTTNLSTTPNNRSMVAQLFRVKAEAEQTSCISPMAGLFLTSKYFTESSTILHQYGSFM